ncbi:MAG: hypothetical protein ACLQUY_07035 [Ktedonobacterales bacterium]
MGMRREIATGDDTAHMETPYPDAAKPRAAHRNARFTLAQRREIIFVLVVLAGTALVRLILALRGWPYTNSDEATLGLMVDDILWHGAHPVFMYGQHHIGSLDAYFQALFFAVFGSTTATMHIVTSIQIVAFLVIFYLFTRRVFSPLIAAVTLILLAFGAEQELFFEMRAGAHAQDVLLLVALLFCLVLLRLGRLISVRTVMLLDAAIGFLVGLCLWSTLLTAPFVLAGLLALAVELARDRRNRPELVSGQRLASQSVLFVGAAIVGMAPLILSNIKTRGATFREILGASNGGKSGLEAILGSPVHLLVSLIQQVGGTFLYSVPSMFGSRTVCPECVAWPSPTAAPTISQILVVIVLGLAFSGLVVGCWLLAALPLARDVWRGWRRRGSVAGGIPTDAELRVRWWGRAMLVIGVGLTILQYASTRAPYVNVGTAPRYIIGIYFGVPLIAAPLVSSLETIGRWLSARTSSRPSFGPSHLLALLGVIVLVAVFTINGVGEASAFQETTNTQQYGVPAGSRDVQLLDFLQAHDATRFYTTWWVCFRLMLDSQERDYCYVVSDSNAFASGNVNSVPAYVQKVTSAAHPAYVFDLTTTEVQLSVPRQIEVLIAEGNPRFTGYTTALVGGYIVFYYAGGSGT